MKKNKNKIKKEVKVFIFDIDDTIACLDRMFIETLNSLSLIESDMFEEISGKNRKFLYPAECGFISEEDEWKALRMFKNFRVWENLDIFPGVQDLLRKITSNGHHIIYITARPFSLRKQTIAWLSNNSLPLPPPELETSYGCYSLQKRTVLMMENDHKKDNLQNAFEFHKGLNREVHYFENDPKQIVFAGKIGMEHMYTFPNGYVDKRRLPKKATVLPHPSDGCYLNLDPEIYK